VLFVLLRAFVVNRNGTDPGDFKTTFRERVPVVQMAPLDLIP